jgi:hypothetical protein
MLFGAIVTLNLALFPPAYTRHLFFAAPILLCRSPSVPVNSSKPWGGGRARAARRATTFGVSWRLLGLAALATYRTVRADKAIESRFLGDALRMGAGSPVWVYFGAQPTVRLIAPPGGGLRFIGMLDPHSGDASWVRRGGVLSRGDPRGDVYLEGFRRVLHNQDSVWLLFTHTSLYVRPEQSLDPYLAIAGSVVGACKLRSAAGPSRLYWCSRRAGG